MSRKLAFVNLADKNCIINQSMSLTQYGLPLFQDNKQAGYSKLRQQQIILKIGLLVLINGNFIQAYCCMTKKKVVIELAGATVLIHIGFWTILEPFQTSDTKLAFLLKNNSQHVFSAKNNEQYQLFKNKFRSVGVLRGFYQDFKPIKKIGEGRNASVFLARERATSKEFAVKAFSKNVMNDKFSYEALENQVSILRSLRSQNIVKFKALYETQKSYYLITEYVSGYTLRNLIETTDISLAECNMIIKNIGMGLRDLAQIGVAHRDLKPENIIIRADNKRPILIDFGLSINCNSKNYLYKHCGTPGFIAPEVLDRYNFEVAPKADIFSLGIVYHLMILKRFPYKNTGTKDILQQNGQANFDFQSSEYSSLSFESKILLSKMLQKNVKERISAAELIQYLSRGQKLRKGNNITKSLEVISEKPELQTFRERKIMLRSSSLRVDLGLKRSQYMRQ